MILKICFVCVKQVIQDQVMVELQDLIVEVDQLMSGIGSLVGKEGVNLCEQINFVLYCGCDVIECICCGVV